MENTGEREPPTGSRLRNRLRATIKNSADFDTFCQDYFIAVYRRFTQNMERVAKENLLFDLADAADIENALNGLTPPPPPPPPSADPLLQRITTACRFKEKSRRDLEIDTIQVDPKLQLIRVSYEDCGHKVCYGLGITREVVDVALLAQFRDLLRQHALDGQLCTDPRLVYFPTTANTQVLSVDVRHASSGPRRILIESSDEYESLIDLREALSRQSRRIAEDSRYPQALYVPQRLEVANGSRLSFTKDEGVALDRIIDWIHRPGGRFVLVLGAFGTGKTFLLYELARQLSRPESSVVPLLITLRSLEKKHNLNDLLIAYMGQENIWPIDPERLRHMCRMGKIVLLFDGFDELALRTDYRESALYLETLFSAVEEEAKVLITSRTEHFLTDQQIATALGKRLATVPTMAAKLQGFNSDQIRRFLSNQFNEAEVQARFALIDQVEDLLGLSENPRMLSLIAQIEPERLQRLGQVEAAHLYGALVEQWIAKEIERKKPINDDSMLTHKQLMLALDDLARQLWASPTSSVKLDGLELATSSALGRINLQDGVTAHQLGSSSLLCRDKDGGFAFFHFSLLEWFIAHKLVKEIDSGGYSVWHQRMISPLMADFISGFLGEDKAKSWTEKILDQFADSDDKEPRPMIRSTQLLAKRLNLPYAQLLELTQEDMTEAKLAPLNLSRTNLRGFDLRGISFVGKDLRGTDLDSAKLEDANLSKADLRKAKLHKADLSRANLCDAKLNGATLSEAKLYRAQLLGAKVNTAQLAGSDTLGAALSELPKVMHIPERLACSHTTALTWHPRGDLLATATADNGIAIYDSLTGECVRVLFGHTDAVLSAAFSLDGKILATGSSDCTVKLWSMETASCLKTLREHRDWVRHVTFSPDGQFLASAADDGSIGLWKMQAVPQLHRMLRHQRRIRGVTFDADSKTMVSASDDGSLYLWRVDDAQWEKVDSTESWHALSVACSPHGGVMAIGTRYGKVCLLKAEAGRSMRTLGHHESWASHVAFSPDGCVLASSGFDGKIRVWSMPSGELLLVLSSDSGRIQRVAFAPDGRIVASLSQDGTVTLWNTASGTQLRTLEHALSPRRDLMWMTSGLCRFSFENRTIAIDLSRERARSRARNYSDVSAGGIVLCLLILGILTKSWSMSTPILLILAGYAVARVPVYERSKSVGAFLYEWYKTGTVNTHG